MRRKGLAGIISTALVIVLILILGMVLSSAGRRPPENPIDEAAETLYAETMSGSSASRKPKEPEEEDPPPIEEEEPEVTPTPTPTPTVTPTPEPERETTPTPEPQSEQQEPQKEEEKPAEGGESHGNEDSGNEQGGGNASGEEGGGNSGGTGDNGSEGGEGGGADEDNTPRIFTDLYNNMYITKSELPDGKLAFQAYALGKGNNLSVRVVLQNENTPANGTVLKSSDNKNYTAELAFNASNYVTIYLKEDGVNIAYVRYKISYYADKADEEHPEVGDYPPTIVTSLDGASLDINIQHIVFWVKATKHPELGGGTIFSNQIQVWLNGELQEKQSGDARPEYDLYFPIPNVGDFATHVVKVLAWDGNGNSTYKYYTVNFERIPEGMPTGKVTVVLDGTAAGLGIMDVGEMDILGGETIASVVVRFLQEYGYEIVYDGTTDNAFYLRTIGRADIGKYSQIPADLQTYLERDGATFTGRPKRDWLGEFDYTRGSGWMYSVNGVVYAGRGMSAYPVQDGSTIYIRFTMAYGKDIGGYDATGNNYGLLSSYCRLWINGTVQDLGHDFRETGRMPATPTSDGYVEYTCSRCHDTKREVLPATGGEPDPTVTPEPTEEPTPTPTPEPTQEPTPEPTEEPTPTPTPEPTEEPTPTPAPDPAGEPGGGTEEP